MLTYEELLALANEVGKKAKGKKLTRFELVKPRVFQIFFEEIPLLLSLQPGAVRFHLLSRIAPASIDPFSNFFQKKLQNLLCKDVSLINEDRLLQFEFEKGLRLIAALFPKKPNLYLVNGEGLIESSLFPIKDPHFVPPHKPERKNLSLPSEITSAQIEFQFAQQEAIAQVKHALDKSRQTTRTLKLELEKCERWEKLHREALLLQSNFHLLQPKTASIDLTDWETGERQAIALDPQKSPQENVKERFRLAKRQQAGQTTLAQSLEKQTAKTFQLEERLQKLSEAFHLEELPQPIPKKAKAVPQKGLPYEEFSSQAGLPIWVGKGAAKNELLTFRYAKGSDWWLHVQGYPGSHVVIRTPKNSPPDEESLQDALTLAIAHSKAKGEKHVEVLVTQRKFVAKLGKTGQVQVSQHKIYHSQFDPNRYNRLKMKGVNR